MFLYAVIYATSDESTLMVKRLLSVFFASFFGSKESGIWQLKI